MIPFVKIPKPNLDAFQRAFQSSVESGHYSNFGPNERKLAELLEQKTGGMVVMAANATLILEGLHDIMGELCSVAYLPGFTFPATNFGCRVPFHFGETQTQGAQIGFALYRPRGGATDYSITTVPFGTTKPKEYVRPDTTFWIVDNAAGASPDMERIREWLDAGADAVVCSLHATKTLSGCEGGFCAFNSRYLFDVYRKYTVFGFYLDENGDKQTEKLGSNHKMSELSAAFTLMCYGEVFPQDYQGRLALMARYSKLCAEHDLRFIASPQAFWVCCDTEASEVAKRFSAKGIQAVPYYRPLWHGESVDAGSRMLSWCGLCLPTWNMTENEADQVMENLNLLWS